MMSLQRISAFRGTSIEKFHACSDAMPKRKGLHGSRLQNNNAKNCNRLAILEKLENLRGHKFAWILVRMPFQTPEDISKPEKPLKMQ